MMKKSLLAVLLLMMFAYVAKAIEPLDLKDYQNESDYTENSVFCISDESGLIKLTGLVNNESFSFTGKTIYLINDITVGSSGDQTLDPVGTESSPFSGTFDGQGCSIKDQRGCLFGYAENASFLNLTLSGVEIDDEDGIVGPIAARAKATDGTSRIVNCHVEGTSLKGKRTGGLVGEITAESPSTFIISGCFAKFDEVYASNGSGGLIGVLTSGTDAIYLTNSYSASSSIRTFRGGAGGLAGIQDGLGKLVVETCYTAGTINLEADEPDAIGGLWGRYSSGDLKILNNVIAVQFLNSWNDKYKIASAYSSNTVASNNYVNKDLVASGG